MDYMLEEDDPQTVAENENTNVTSTKMISKYEAPILYFDAKKNAIEVPATAPKKGMGSFPSEMPSRNFATSTWMPPVTASSAPSQRIRFTSPLISMRASICQLRVTAYQPVPSTVSPV